MQNCFMTIWPPEISSLDRPVYRSLAQSLIEAIGAGEVRQGDRLPTHRELARHLGLSVQTVSRAYDELCRLGIVAGKVGRGTFVRAAGGEERTPWHRIGDGDEVVDFSMLTPVTGEIHTHRMQAALAQLSRDVPSDVLFSFRPRAALLRHAEAALPWLRRCRMETRRTQIVPTNGNTAAMTVALMTAAKPGDLVAAANLSHHTLKPLCRYLGLRLKGLEVDEEGITPDSFERACTADGARVLFAMPNGLNARAATMGPGRRAEIARIAQAHGATIVENDAWGPIQPERHPPLAAYAPEHTFYFTGLTKCLLPGLRYGWLVVPETHVSAAANRHLVTHWMATALMAEIGTRWLEDGTADELLHWQQAALDRRNRIALDALKPFRPSSSPNGLHLWLPLPEQWEEDAFVTHARLEGVAVAAGSAFAVAEPAGEQGIRICVGCSTEAGLARGLEVIARLARNQPEPALLTI